MTLLGYARVSTGDQDLTIQRAQLEAAGCTRIFAEKITGKHAQRPELVKLLDYLRPGDVVTVTRLDHFARNTRDLLNLAEPWADTTSPVGRMVLTIFAGLTEFERSLILERTSTGRAAALAKGVKFGRRPTLSDEQKALAKKLAAEGQTPAQIGKLLGVHRTTIARTLDAENGDKTSNVQM